MEYKATLNHLEYLEKKYDIKIRREKAVKPIPYIVKHMGQPFISKTVSEYLQRLQKHNFQFDDLPLNDLVKKYCIKADAEKAAMLDEKVKAVTNEKDVTVNGWYRLDGEWYRGLISALKWWCNAKNDDGADPSWFNISRNKYLKEFILSNPPGFEISNMCCKYVKKDVAKHYQKTNDIELTVLGIRRAEGAQRAASYKTCYTTHKNGIDSYLPLFWYTNDDKKEYEEYFNIIHSDCYTKYGMSRTGCVGCPYGLKLSEELDVMKKYEPNLYKAVNNIFKNSYEYTQKYREFQKTQKEHDKGDQL